MTIKPGIPLLEAALAEVNALGLHLKRLNRPPHALVGEPDAWVQLAHGGEKLALPVLVRRNLPLEALGAVAHRMSAWDQGGLLVLDQATTALADALRAQGIAFMDGAGNAYLHFPPLFVWVKGQRKPKGPAHSEPQGRAFQPRGLQVLFALLCQPGLVDCPYREIAIRACVAHGTVGGVMAELPKLGFLAEVKGHRRLLNEDRLLSQWVEAYARTLRPKLLLGALRSELLDWVPAADLKPFGLLMGGEPAADRLTRYLQPGTATFFGQKVDPRFVAAHRLRKEGLPNVEFRRQFWNFDGEEPGLVPAILVYADLLAIGDGRCLETAALLLDKIHARFV